MPTQTTDKNASPVRDRTAYIGTDARGREYIFKTERDPAEIVVVHAGERVLVDALHDASPRDVAHTVARDIGWRECRWGAVEAEPLPRKHGGRR